MRQIHVSVDVFAKIWSLRIENEDTEDAILRRILFDLEIKTSPSFLELEEKSNNQMQNTNPHMPATSDPKWWEVVKAALANLKGEASLSEIYQETTRICIEIQKPIPESLEATIRGTLEDNCAESDRYKHVRDVFCMPLGKHKGVWGLK